MYDVLHGVTATACDHGYGLVFTSNRVFWSKKYTLHVLLSEKTQVTIFNSLLISRGTAKDI